MLTKFTYILLGIFLLPILVAFGLYLEIISSVVRMLPQFDDLYTGTVTAIITPIVIGIPMVWLLRHYQKPLLFFLVPYIISAFCLTAIFIFLGGLGGWK